MGQKFTRAGLPMEVYPLPIIVTSVLSGIAAFIFWQMNSREIQVNRRRKPINERVDLLNPRVLKLMVVEFPPEPSPELHSIYQEMEEEKKNRMEEVENLRKQGKKKGKKHHHDHE